MSPIDPLLPVLFTAALCAERAAGIAGAMVESAAGAGPIVAVVQQATPTGVLFGRGVEMLDIPVLRVTAVDSDAANRVRKFIDRPLAVALARRAVIVAVGWIVAVRHVAVS